MSAPTTRVLLADDHAFYREGIRAMLDGLPDISVVGEATTGEEALSLAQQVHPDVLLMDIKMPGMNGIEATRRIMAALPQTRIIMVTMFEEDTSVFAAMRAGARGYLLKDADRDDLLLAIRAVARGEAIFSPAIAQRMMHYFATLAQGTPTLVFPELSEREREVLNLIAQGQSNAAIANRLVLSLKTVQNHVSNILNKLQVADRTQAMLRAREAGMGHDAE